jgi:hypothetical protein
VRGLIVRARAGLLSVARRWRQRWGDDRRRALPVGHHHLAFVHHRNGRVPFGLATAGVCDCPDIVSCALAKVAASANTNAIASLDMTGFLLLRAGPTRDRGETGRQDRFRLLGLFFLVLEIGPAHVTRLLGGRKTSDEL